MGEGLDGYPDPASGLAAGRSRVARRGSSPGRWSLEEVALCKELRSAYERLHVLASGRHYDQLAKEVSKTQGLVDELRLMASAVGSAHNVTAGAFEPEDPSRPLRSDIERSLTEILRERGRLLQALDLAVQETQAVLARLTDGRRALECYRNPRSTAPRLESRRV